MFIHLGEDTVVRTQDVIAILDNSLLESSEMTQEFIAENQKCGLVHEISEGSPKSIVVTKDAVFYSPLSSATLKKRSQMIHDLDNVQELEGDG
ncbi:DUF370 domain-containing protein [Bacillaceae bacterium SIJ1]|uniref:extracellular matrix regulator RemB n=1 Tax=Litoribacterium kuwaitense TaxID=1398745 RepID=UPI0013EA23DC|nr:extracellular matrix/biofilm biosynthesis regulator RemA family protein [Litoribacterium kuwaitense]NGP45192.1 DUF370 domain-containing protein [Litoribacterium kuwaitense]